MKKFLPVLIIVAVVVGLAIWTYAGQEGQIGTNPAPDIQQLASMADWYTMKSFKASSKSGTIYTVSTSLPGYLVKGLYNNRRDSSVTIKAITSIGDTVNFSIPTETILGKLPILAKFIIASCSDSAYLLCQKR